MAVPCPLCGGGRFREVAVVDRWQPAFRVVRCEDCSLLHVNPRPPREELDSFYDDAYYAGTADWHYADERTREPQVRVRAAGRLARVEAMLARSGVVTRRVVEMGSAYGVFLDEARRRGWEVAGCEVSADAAAWTRAHRGMTVHECDLADAGLAPDIVDVVTGSEVAEHLAEPKRTLRAAFDALSPGGVLLLSTANERSVARAIRGPRWGYFMPGHVVLWSAATLRRLLAEIGFVDVRVTAGDERGLPNFLAFRRAARGGSLLAWMLRRVRIGDWTLGAGMVVTARKPPAGRP